MSCRVLPTAVPCHRARGADVAADVLNTGELARPNDSVQGEEGQAGTNRSKGSTSHLTSRFTHKNACFISISNGRQDPPSTPHLGLFERRPSSLRYLARHKFEIEKTLFPVADVHNLKGVFIFSGLPGCRTWFCWSYPGAYPGTSRVYIYPSKHTLMDIFYPTDPR